MYFSSLPLQLSVCFVCDACPRILLIWNHILWLIVATNGNLLAYSGERCKSTYSGERCKEMFVCMMGEENILFLCSLYFSSEWIFYEMEVAMAFIMFSESSYSLCQLVHRVGGNGLVSKESLSLVTLPVLCLGRDEQTLAMGRFVAFGQFVQPLGSPILQCSPVKDFWLACNCQLQHHWLFQVHQFRSACIFCFPWALFPPPKSLLLNNFCLQAFLSWSVCYASGVCQTVHNSHVFPHACIINEAQYIQSYQSIFHICICVNLFKGEI